MREDTQVRLIQVLEEIRDELKTTNVRLSQIEDRLDHIYGGMM